MSQRPFEDPPPTGREFQERACMRTAPWSDVDPPDALTLVKFLLFGDAYQTGLAFENVLVNELAQQLAATVPGLDGSSGSDDGLGGSSDDGLGGTSDDSSGSSGGLGAYSSLLPQTLASSIMSGGGTGIAMQLAKSIDPALGAPKK